MQLSILFLLVSASNVFASTHLEVFVRQALFDPKPKEILVLHPTEQKLFSLTRSAKGFLIQQTHTQISKPHRFFRLKLEFETRDSRDAFINFLEKSNGSIEEVTDLLIDLQSAGPREFMPTKYWLENYPAQVTSYSIVSLIGVAHFIGWMENQHFHTFFIAPPNELLAGFIQMGVPLSLVSLKIPYVGWQSWDSPKDPLRKRIRRAAIVTTGLAACSFLFSKIIGL